MSGFLPLSIAPGPDEGDRPERPWWPGAVELETLSEILGEERESPREARLRELYDGAVASGLDSDQAADRAEDDLFIERFGLEAFYGVSREV